MYCPRLYAVPLRFVLPPPLCCASEVCIGPLSHYSASHYSPLLTLSPLPPSPSPGHTCPLLPPPSFTPQVFIPSDISLRSLASLLGAPPLDLESFLSTQLGVSLRYEDGGNVWTRRVLGAQLPTGVYCTVYCTICPPLYDASCWYNHRSGTTTCLVQPPQEVL